MEQILFKLKTFYIFICSFKHPKTYSTFFYYARINLLPVPSLKRHYFIYEDVK